MNICLVKNQEIGLSETFIRAHAERLPARVEVMEGTPPKWRGEKVLSNGLVARSLRKLRRIWGEHHEASHSTEAYIDVLRRTNAEVVLAEYGPSGVRVLTACEALGLPLVVHFHGYDASVHQTLEKYAAGYQRMFEQAAGIVAVSRAMRDALIALGAPPQKVHHVVYGIDPESFVFSDASLSEPRFLSVGRFVDKKAPHLTILAFAEMNRMHPEARLCMIGDGPLWGACSDLVRALGLNEVIELAGAQPHERVQLEMQRARAFVQHSVTAVSGDMEGTPVAVLEAGMSGLPVIATRHAGIPDVVVEGKTGLLSDERDISAMAGHLSRLAADAALAGRLGRAAHEHIVSHYRAEQSIDQLWQVIQESVQRYHS